jgi:hypothetical protein
LRELFFIEVNLFDFSLAVRHHVVVRNGARKYFDENFWDLFSCPVADLFYLPIYDSLWIEALANQFLAQLKLIFLADVLLFGS